ncbi:DUF1127 domain-containing protein [Denitrobaculum tricleocarpae]|nr:DUF1127 domain-containing protein [Denitrobaculum tricleocarpae]
MTTHSKAPANADASARNETPPRSAVPSAARSFLLSVLAALRHGCAKQRHNRARRRAQKLARDAFMATVRLDDRMLDDIGVTREEVQWAAGLPLAFNAARALHSRARARRRRAKAGPNGSSRSPDFPNTNLSAGSLIASPLASTGPQWAKPYRLWAL